MLLTSRASESADSRKAGWLYRTMRSLRGATRSLTVFANQHPPLALPGEIRILRVPTGAAGRGATVPPNDPTTSNAPVRVLRGPVLPG